MRNFEVVGRVGSYCAFTAIPKEVGLILFGSPFLKCFSLPNPDDYLACKMHYQLPEPTDVMDVSHTLLLKVAALAFDPACPYFHEIPAWLITLKRALLQRLISV